MLRFCVLSLTLMALVSVFAQDAPTSVPYDSISSSRPELTTTIDSTLHQSEYPLPAIPLAYRNPSLMPLDAMPTLTPSPYFFDKSQVVPRLGNLSGYTVRQDLPGLMGIESAGLSYNLSMGNLSLTPSVFADKYGFYGGLVTSYGFGGTLNYTINEKFGLTIFGEYHSNSWAMNPAVMANMGSSRFGGYATWNINDNWGLSMGAQRVYNSATNRWQNVPILMPMYKINGRDAIGIDVGGLLYQIIDSKRNGGWNGPVNPTIAPPSAPQITFGPRD